MRIILLIICSCFLTRFAFGQLVLYSSNWKYYDLGMAPPFQSGVSWMQSAYSDVSWNSGPGQLGYGDGDEATLISSATLTGYFRQTFYVNDVADFSNLILQLIYDDGAVIYINGVEVWRKNMPSGTITYGTFASSNSGDNATAADTVINSLVNGANVVAVEVHQVSSSSSDISFDMSILGVPAPGITVVTRGPYLQRANASSAIIRWRTNVASASIVDFGLATNMLSNTINDPASTTEHVITVTGLAPSTKYYYQIRIVGDTLIFPASDVYFKTYPVGGTAAPLTAWILGDCGTANSNARNVRNAYYNYIGTQPTDMMLFLGDNAYVDGTDAEYQKALFQNMYEQKLKNTLAWSCLGNHDGHSANSNMQTGPYYDIFTFPVNGECGGVASGTEAYYSFDFGNVHFIVLDSYGTDRSATGPMHTWCVSDLQNTLADWIITFWHHPAYSKGSHDSDVDIELKQMRENFLP
ncbi:MAG: metallophosphoesterase family protein, partial [Saprospiraceae bacterium]